jgi:hypothetical protein
MTKLVLIHPGVYNSPKDLVLLESFASDVISIAYDNVTKEQLLAYESVSQIAFLYHYPGYESLPFFVDDKPTYTDALVEPIEPVKSKYHYFSDKVIDVITSLRDAHSGSEQFIVDILSCDLNSQSYKDEVALIESDLNINIRYSVDKTGNPSSGANWILESDTVNVKDVYFTDTILSWNNVLTVDIANNIKTNTTFSAFITWNALLKTYTVQKDFKWSDFVIAGSITDLDPFIQLLENEIFDGNGYTIDLETRTGWKGLFATGGTSLSNSSLIKNLGILGGTTVNNAGFIVRHSQKFFKVENCYSTGTIGQNAGGISGINSGYFGGNCTITNCYSTGTIGDYTGGISGQYSGNNNGRCTIANCYSTGTIIGYGSGGISGHYSGFTGNCTITNCYSTGTISGFGAGGISGMNSGSFCTITNCYSTGTISGFGAGGITGQSSICTITNCVSNSPTAGLYSSSNSTNNSTTLSNLNTILSTDNTWLSTVWVYASNSVTFSTDGISNYIITLPVLKAFQASPWITATTNELYYNQATDSARFYSIPITTPISSVPSVNGVAGKNITVNLNVSVDAAGQIDVFGADEEVLSNVLYAEYNMDVSALYSTDVSGVQSGLIEFWEPSTALGDIQVAYADDIVNGVAMKETQAKLVAQELQKVLVNTINAQNPDNAAMVASPFNDNKYKVNGTYIETYIKHREFGRLALSAYAHYIFGHQAATSAITNDQAFIENMLSLTNGQDDTTAEKRYTSWNKLTGTGSVANDISTWFNDTSAADANIALRLAKAICNKDVLNTVSGALAGDLANIVKQVIGQDATRAMGQDNNELAPGVKHKLRFYAGDKIVVSIKLAAPTVQLGTSGIPNNQNDKIKSSLYDTDMNTSEIDTETYALVITLGNK